MKTRASCLSLFTLATILSISACSESPKTPTSQNTPAPKSETTKTDPAEKKEPIRLTFILTNDIHGNFEAHYASRQKQILGGLAHFSTIVQTLRSKPEYANNESALMVLDGGDQFQGTLLSNYDEGQSIFKVLDTIQYDAIVPGNHDYDFGPFGWLKDQVDGPSEEHLKREVIQTLASQVHFPLLSANTYFRKSIKTQSGASVELNDSCQPQHSTPREALDFTRATRPEFLKPYQIFTKAGVRIAVIGIDHHQTSSVTTYSNVSDLCFRDETAAYLDTRKELEGQADVFVLLIHNGDTSQSKDASEIVTRINAKFKNGVDLAAAGHTHYHHDHLAGAVHVVQDGAQAEHYGRVDLFFDPNTKTVLHEKTEANHSIPIVPDDVAADPKIESIIQSLRTKIAPLAGRILGTIEETVTRSRLDESALGNIVTDATRAVAQTEVALYNTGGVRADLQPGSLTYEKLYTVLPFANHLNVISKMKWKDLKSVLTYSLQSCGGHGILNVSGLRIKFSRACSATSQNDDPNLKLLLVTMDSGKTLLDSARNFEVPLDTEISVATLDFIASGGSGYSAFEKYSNPKDLGLARELIAAHFEKTQPKLKNKTDGRLKLFVHP